MPSWEKQAQEDERAARPQSYQWKCPRYNLTWDDLEQFLRRRFPSETFEEFQVSRVVAKPKAVGQRLIGLSVG